MTPNELKRSSMWRLNPEIQPATLDFTSSGQGKLDLSRLVSDGVEIINAIELVNWDSDDSQFLLCEACGFFNCKSGDWVSVRRIESQILILPASQYVWGETNGKAEYQPPQYLKKNGPAHLDISTYESLRRLNSNFPPVEQISWLKMREAALLFHLLAPAKVLGEPPQVRVCHDVFLGTSEGDFVEYLEQVETLLHAHYDDESNATLRDRFEDEDTISFYLDVDGFKEWIALVFDGLRYHLVVDSQYVISND